MKRWPSAIASSLLLGLLGVYRRFISPGLAPRCKYYPSCSAYAEQAVRELGPLRGAIVAGWRLLRCNPLSDGGIDELADRRLFRDRTAPARTPAANCRAHDHGSGRGRPRTDDAAVTP